MQNLFPDERVISTDLFDIHQDWEVPIPGFFILATKRPVRSVDWMKPFGTKVECLRPIVNHAKEHMNTPEVAKEVKEYAAKMKDYMA